MPRIYYQSITNTHCRRVFAVYRNLNFHFLRNSLRNSSNINEKIDLRYVQIKFQLFLKIK